MNNTTHKTWCVIVFIFHITLLYSEHIIRCPINIYREDGSSIIYYVHKDTTPTNDLLVILQGSDCNSVMNNKSREKLRSIYSEADLLTVEKYGISETLPYSAESERKDCPAAYIEKDNPYQRSDDVIKIIEKLRSYYEYKKIIIIGGSEGSIVANLITSRVNFVTATIVFGGGGRFFRDDVLHSMKKHSTSASELEENIKRFLQFEKYILSSAPFPVVMSDHGYSWWKSMLSIDQEQLLQSVHTPVLIVQGSDDFSASTEKASEMYESLRKNGKTNIDYYLYHGYDHSLNLTVHDSASNKFINDVKVWLLGINQET